VGAVERFDAFQRRHPVTSFPLAVAYKFADDRGPHLAALMTYYGFVSLFPLLLLLTSVSGFVLSGDPQLQQRLVDAALSSFPGLGDQLEANVRGLQGSTTAVVVGAVGTVYGGLGVMQAAQAALNRIYAVPRFAQPNPVMARVRSFGLIVALGLAAVVAVVISVLQPRLADLVPAASGLISAGARLVPLGIDVGIFFVVFHVLAAERLAWRDVAVGAVIAGTLWALLTTAGAAVAEGFVRRSDVYGVFGVVLGLMAWIYLQSLVVVLAAEINVVRQRRLYPRALLTPFTDDVDLTPQDVRVYTGYARSERYKGFERVETSFRRGPAAPPREVEGFPEVVDTAIADAAQDGEAADEPRPSASR
jgi:YihY family inner membrane protein